MNEDIRLSPRELRNLRKNLNDIRKKPEKYKNVKFTDGWAEAIGMLIDDCQRNLKEEARR